jgi:hypothetical protein
MWRQYVFVDMIVPWQTTSPIVKDAFLTELVIRDVRIGFSFIQSSSWSRACGLTYLGTDEALSCSVVASWLWRICFSNTSSSAGAPTDEAPTSTVLLDAAATQITCQSWSVPNSYSWLPCLGQLHPSQRSCRTPVASGTQSVLQRKKSSTRKKSSSFFVIRTACGSAPCTCFCAALTPSPTSFFRGITDTVPALVFNVYKLNNFIFLDSWSAYPCRCVSL